MELGGSYMPINYRNVAKLLTKALFAYRCRASGFDELARVVRRVGVLLEAVSPSKRPQLLDSIEDRDLNMLIGFASRCSVAAVREKSIQRVIDGLTALAIESGRLGAGDSLAAMAILYHSTCILGQDPFPLFQKAAILAQDKSFGELLFWFPKRRPIDRGVPAFHLRESISPEGFIYEPDFGAPAAGSEGELGTDETAEDTG